jgi:hypothetical protein
MKLKLTAIAFLMLAFTEGCSTPRPRIPAPTKPELQAIAPKIETPVLVVDKLDMPAYPEDYREDPKLSLSGSAQFSENELVTILKRKKQYQVYVVDLRQENHAFVNGSPVTWQTTNDWGNLNLDPEQIIGREKSLIQTIGVKQTIRLPSARNTRSKFPLAEMIDFKVDRVEDEETMVKRLGAHYIRLSIPTIRDFSATEVDRFLNEMRKLPKNAWVHIHGRNGGNRTALFMVMYEILMRKNETIEQVVRHQAQLGDHGYDVLEVHDDDSRQVWDLSRRDFIANYTNYVRTRQFSFSDWMKLR